MTSGMILCSLEKHLEVFLRRFCGDFRFKSGSENQKWKPNFCLRKIGNPLCLLGFPDSIYLGCPDGLEPSTFRTTSHNTDFQQTPLYIAVSED